LPARPAAGKVDDHERFGAPSDESGDGRQGNDTARQHRRAEKRVDERALAALELAEDRKLQALVGKAANQRPQPRGQRRFEPDRRLHRRLNATKDRGESGQFRLSYPRGRRLVH
jgi:hypothetical protein